MIVLIPAFRSSFLDVTVKNYELAPLNKLSIIVIAIIWQLSSKQKWTTFLPRDPVSQNILPITQQMLTDFKSYCTFGLSNDCVMS